MIVPHQGSVSLNVSESWHNFTPGVDTVLEILQSLEERNDSVLEPESIVYRKKPGLED